MVRTITAVTEAAGAGVERWLIATAAAQPERNFGGSRSWRRPPPTERTIVTPTPQPRVLVVDDDADVTRLLATSLEREGYIVVQAATAMEAFDRFARDEPDLVIIDVMMPVVSGLEVLEHIRRKGSTPVIVLSALGDEECRIRGFRLGADDYVVKPFSIRELAARVGVLLRRAGGSDHTTTVIQHRDLVVNLAEREVWARGVLVETTALEFDLLAFLAGNPGRVFTRHELLRDVWGSSAEWQQEGTVTEHVRRLRVKLEADPAAPFWLQTVRGVGYRFNRRTSPRPEAEADAA
jgi:DNA-binding response OmpR family regulator